MDAMPQNIEKLVEIDIMDMSIKVLVIYLPTPRVFALEMRLGQTFDFVKNHCAAAIGINPNRLRLTSNGSDVPDDQTPHGMGLRPNQPMAMMAMKI